MSTESPQRDFLIFLKIYDIINYKKKKRKSDMKFLWCDMQKLQEFKKDNLKWIHPIDHNEVIDQCAENPCVVSLGFREVHLNTLRAMAQAGVDAIIHFHIQAEDIYRRERPTTCKFKDREILFNICKENGWDVIYDDEIERFA